MKKIITTLLCGVLLAACKENTNKPVTSKTEETVNTKDDIFGKSATITYPKMKVEVSYINDSTLHWKDVLANGEIKQGNEHIYYKRLSQNLHFINWTEESGITISQVLDTGKETVNTYLTYENPKNPRGKRNSDILLGTIKFLK